MSLRLQKLLPFAIFLFSFLTLLIPFQMPYTYSLQIGDLQDEWQVIQGFGERENNENFSFRWTIDEKAELRLPDVGSPSRIGLVGVAPRPDNSQPKTTISAEGVITSFLFAPTAASLPPDSKGRLTFEASGASPAFRLLPQQVYIASPLFQPKNDPRSLGIVVSLVYVKTTPNSFGLVLPPLSLWLGWSLLVTLVFINLSYTPQKGKSFSAQFLRQYSFTALALMAGILGRILLPTPYLVYGANLAWGALLPLLFLSLSRWSLLGRIFLFQRPAWGLLALQLFGVTLAFYNLVGAVFVGALLAVSGLILLSYAWKGRFSGNLENCSLLVSGSVASGWGFWQGRIPYEQDTIIFHLYWVNELDRLIKLGNLYPRWSPIFNYQLGGSIFNFYPPFGRYLTEAFHLLGMTVNNSTMATQFAIIVAGIFGAYFLCVEIIKDKQAALLGAFIYCYFPYRLADMYTGGTLAFQLAGAVTPYILWLMLLLVRHPTKQRYWFWLGFSAALLALSNVPAVLCFAPIAVIFLVGLLGLQWKHDKLVVRQTLLGLMVAGAVAFGLSAFYLIPTAVENGLLSQDLNQNNLAETGAHFNFFSDSSESFALWRPIKIYIDDFRVFGTLHFWLGGVGLLFLLTSRRVNRPLVILLASITAFVIFLQYPPSKFIWQLYPLSSTVQYASRLMYALAALLAPLIAGLAIRRKTLPGRLLTLISSLLAVVLTLYACFYSFNPTYLPFKFDGAISVKILTEQVRSADPMYLPKGWSNLRNFDHYRTPQFDDQRPSSPADTLSWNITGSDSYQLEATLSKPGSVTVPLIFYPGWWFAKDVQGQTYSVTQGVEAPFVQLNLPAGVQRITVKLQDTPDRLVGNWLTMLTLAGVGGYSLYRWLRGKRPRLMSAPEPTVIQN
ncbi:hypothetical protein [Candidatus Chlorohelix sp.]|uniref:hypothetical protein n=1 Tax=Candidatus Chlorohelix sp. TaxID=3139201 RepID=UPI00303BCA9E